LNEFARYKIVVIVDDNDINLVDFISTYKNITFIQINNENCKLHGYTDSNFIINKLISGWDKALYYFGIENVDCDFIWFMEDDVFFYNENTLIQIDEKYIDDDLLSSYYYESDGNKSTWHWNSIEIKFAPPYYCAMVCAVRFSKNMMKCINNYVLEHKKLGFIEALFPTVAKKNMVKYSTPDELAEIHYRHNFVKNDIRKQNIYHPVKNLNIHIEFRND